MTGFDAAEGGGEAVGDISRPFCPHAASIGAMMPITAAATMILDAWRRTLKLVGLFCIDRF